MTNSIDSSLYLSSVSSTSSTSSTIDKDGFLKILMAQLQNQDPTNPMDDAQFVEQMTSFTNLEQLMNIGEAVESLASNQSAVSPVLQYSNLIGKQVTYNEYDETTGDVTNTITSEVTAVSQYNGQAVLELSNGKEIYALAVTKVENIED